jgi:membrane-bound lytic murein transglycosylase B
VLNFDRRQHGTFNKTFEQYVSTHVGPGHIDSDRTMLQHHPALLSRIETVRRAAGRYGWRSGGWGQVWFRN